MDLRLLAAMSLVFSLVANPLPAASQVEGTSQASRDYLGLVRIPVRGCDDEQPLERLAEFSNNYELNNDWSANEAARGALNGARLQFADRYYHMGCYAVAEQLYYDAIRGGAHATDLATAQAGLARSLARR